MGMFENYPPFEDAFKKGDTFNLLGAKLGAKMNTVHGESQQVLFKIDHNGDTKVYSAFGAGFAGQAARAEPGDFPVEVEYIETPPKKAGRSGTKLLWPVGAPRPGQPGAPDVTADDDIPS